MRIAALIKPHSGVDYHRIILPMRYFPMSDGDSIITITNTKPLHQAMLEKVDIVFFSRECPFEFDKILEMRKSMGFKIVVDVDDYWYLYPGHYLNDFWIKNRVSEKTIESIKAADKIICTHKPLANRIRPYNENVHSIVNALPLGYEQFIAEPTLSTDPSIVYAAGASHLNDLRSISPALHMLAYDPALKGTKFVLAGYSPRSKTWSRIRQIAETYGNCEVRESLPLNRYMDHYNNATVAIAPLQNNEFNSLKSELKAVEAGCKQIPIVASAVHPYLALDGVRGVVLCKSNKDWYNALKKFLTQPWLAAEYGKALYDHVSIYYDLVKVNPIRKSIFNSLL